ncbi:MAG: ATP-binding cassette domain-containing protein, partial [Cyclobacteriaceae bacterium]
LRDERFNNFIETEKMSIDEFQSLQISDLAFRYKNEDESNGMIRSFGVGPIDFSIRTGEVIFIYGGNGSGKTTMINVILGILKSDSGSISYNGIPLTSENYSNYRALFSVVFSDYHLFEELYGFETIDEEEVDDYLKLFELNDKVKFENLRFSSHKLSTGQRKRLALINAIIIHKPILVLDEWAADQDPVFRKKFYTEIIPLLKSRNFSVIAITHDDAYYHVADKLYEMRSGQLSLLTPSELI